MVNLIEVEVSHLDIFSNPRDARRDVPIYLRYMQEREVKRLYRSNALPKPDALRLAKLMSDPEAEAEVREQGQAGWLNYVDWLAWKLGLVSYDAEGSYAGYSSAERTYPDNYVLFNPEKCRAFTQSPLADQERLWLNTLLAEREGCRSEFFAAGVLGRLGSFSSWGCATGVVPHLDFPKVRRFLLELLAACPVGVWYSTASLIQYLKAKHPFFLIPQKPRYKDSWGKQQKRYVNFHESKQQWGYEIEILEHEADAFERVEGRYVERFLEGLPLILGYVEVAYTKQPYHGLHPSLNQLQAFRVNGRLRRALQGDIPPPKVTVQPNFEIYVESEFYPANVLAQLLPLTEVMAEGVSTILKLQKEKVAAQAAQDETLDVVRLLAALSGQELPRNVARELHEWVAHSEKFTLYQGFALLEGDERLPLADPFTVERITPTLRLVHSPEELLAQLEQAELVPLRVNHPEDALQPLPARARTVFPIEGETARPKPKEKEGLTLFRQTMISLRFPSSDTLEMFRKALLDARCPVEVDKERLTLTFLKHYEPHVMKVMQALAEVYLVRVEEVG